MLDRALSLDKELRLATRLAAEAGAVVRQIQAEGVVATMKADDTPVTRADLASDELIRQGLQHAFPGDGILSEEAETRFLSETGRTWVVDPLDGTKGFISDTGDYTIQIALVEDGQPVLGVVHEPETGRTYQGIAGVASFMTVGTSGSTVRQLRVSTRTAYPQMAFVTSLSMPDADRSAVLGKCGFADGTCAHSVGLKVGMLIRREADVYFSGHPVSYWDFCAPLVILEASGGRITLMDARPLVIDVEGDDFVLPGPFLATNGTRHEELCQVLSDVLGLGS